MPQTLRAIAEVPRQPAPSIGELQSLAADCIEAAESRKARLRIVVLQSLAAD